MLGYFGQENWQFPVLIYIQNFLLFLLNVLIPIMIIIIVMNNKPSFFYLFQTMSKNLIGMASALNRNRDLRDFFLDIVEKVRLKLSSLKIMK